MNLIDFWPLELSISGAATILKPLVVFVFGMVVYAVFIFKFYRFVASKDIFTFDLSKYEKSNFRGVRTALHVIFYVGKYLVLFPVVAMFWFGVLTVLLAFLAKNQDIGNVLLVSMAVVSTIRIAAYYNEDLSKDLAKILPFALLGVFVVDLSYFRVSDSLTSLQLAAGQREAIVYYLAFVILLEFALRISYPVIHFFTVTLNRDAAGESQITEEGKTSESQPAQAD
ncbi:MAG: hypothetical protein ACE5Q6_25190 [Dehalococcoidia bacterium]